MEEKLLRAFVTVAEVGTVSGAAIRLDLVQSALSRQLQRLQRELRLPLFARVGGRLELTTAGEAFLPVAREVLVAHRRAEQAARTLASGRLTDVAVAAPGTTLIDVVLPFVATFGEEDPRPRVAETQLDDSLLDAVARHDLVVMPTVPPPSVASLPLMDLPVWAYVAPGHPWAGRTRVSLDDLVAQPVVAPARTFMARRVLDGAVAVFDGKEGVEPQSETVWRQADKYGVPRMCFINKMDKMGADFYFSVQTMVDRLGATPLVMQLPIGAESDFEGVVDLISMKALTWRGETKLGEEYATEEIPADLQAKAEEYRNHLIEKVAEADEELLEKYLGGEELTEDEIKQGVRKLTLANEVNPVFCGTAFKNKGVQPLLDAVIDYLPSPIDVNGADGHQPGDEETVIHRNADAEEPFAALAFKIAAHPFYGTLTYIRVYSGQITAGSQVMNATKGKKERLGKLFQMHANKENPVDKASAGHIYAVIGLKDTTTGDTLSDLNEQIILESMTFPEPVIHVAIEPKTKGDQEKLGTAIQRLAQEDPTFTVRLDEETGQTVIGGMGELHLDILVDRMKREFKVEANVGKPQVAYRETIRKTVEKHEFTHKKQTGGSGQFAKVQIALEPLEMGGDAATYEFENKVTGGRIPREYIPSVDQGAQEAMEFGILAGYPMVDVKVALEDGAYHDVDSSELAFKIAGNQAFKEAARQARPVLLEPMFAVEVTTPEDYLGTVIGDINSRRGQIRAQEERHGDMVVDALVPLSEMFGYVGDLRSKTSGQASYSMEFDSYAEVPQNVADEIIKKVRGE